MKLPLWKPLYSAYAAFMFALFGCLGLLVLLCLPKLAWRRRYVRRLGKFILLVLGIRVTLVNRQPLATPCIVVANHISYLDGVVMAATLPASFGFVIKREMASVPVAGLLLQRIGSHFVERKDRAKGAVDARRLLRHASRGDALVFFPEGTFLKEHGLGRFHMGAFAIAARCGLPVVPVAITGTRYRLPPGSVWASPGRVQIEILPALGEPPADVDHAQWLRDAARAALLDTLHEPDLARQA
jgi:1-acyl-sn-glycerol-3-phosphate acyltransferase